MFILDYGLMAKSSKTKGVITHLSDGVPEGDSFLDTVDLYYNGQKFAVLKENPDHISLTFVWKGIQRKDGDTFPYLGPIMVEKNRVYQEHGRTETILSNILLILTNAGAKGEFFDGLLLKIRELLDEHYHYIFAEERTEAEV